jgi:hypothetical protein
VKRAFVISPYSGDINRNIAYAQKCLTFCFSVGYAPFAGHLVYPMVLNDADPQDRDFGMRAAYAFLSTCDVAFCFMDLHVSSGMRADLLAAVHRNIRIDYVSIYGGIPTVDGLHTMSLPHAHIPCALCQIESEKQSTT